MATATTRKQKVTTRKQKVTLDDLSPADRERLLVEAAGTIASDDDVRQQAETARAAERNAAIAALLDDRDHLRGCPADGRVEAYGDRKPANPARAIPAKDVTVIRCIECGGSTVIERSYAGVIADLEAASDDD